MRQGASKMRIGTKEKGARETATTPKTDCLKKRKKDEKVNNSQ